MKYTRVDARADLFDTEIREQLPETYPEYWPEERLVERGPTRLYIPPTKGDSERVCCNILQGRWIVSRDRETGVYVLFPNYTRNVVTSNDYDVESVTVFTDTGKWETIKNGGGIKSSVIPNGTGWESAGKYIGEDNTPVLFGKTYTKNSLFTEYGKIPMDGAIIKTGDGDSSTSGTGNLLGNTPTSEDVNDILDEINRSVSSESSSN